MTKNKVRLIIPRSEQMVINGLMAAKGSEVANTWLLQNITRRSGEHMKFTKEARQRAYDIP